MPKRKEGNVVRWEGNGFDANPIYASPTLKKGGEIKHTHNLNRLKSMTFKMLKNEARENGSEGENTFTPKNSLIHLKVNKEMSDAVKNYNAIQSEKRNEKVLQYRKEQFKSHDLTPSDMKDGTITPETITKERVVAEIAKLAFGKRLGEATNFVRDDIKLKALDMLGRWIGLYERDNAQKIANTQLLQITFVGEDGAELRKQQLLDAENSLKAEVEKQLDAVEPIKEMPDDSLFDEI